MSSTLMIYGILFQLIFGILVPFLFQLFKPRSLNKPIVRRIVTAWKYFAWGLFFIITGIFITTRFVIGRGVGGILAFVIGVIPFCILAIVFILQSLATWHRRFD